MGKYALILVLALIFSMITYAHGLQNALLNSSNRNIQSFSQNQANNIAQGAASFVINHLRNHDSGSMFYAETDDIIVYPSANTFEEWPEMFGAYNLVISNQGDTVFTVQSTGRFEDTIYRVSLGLASFDPDWDFHPNQALHAEDYIKLNGSGDTVTGDVTINNVDGQTVNLGNDKIKIEGDMYVGPGGDPGIVVSNHNAVDGDTPVMPRLLKYPMPQFPAFPVGSINLPAITTSQTIYPTDYEGSRFQEIDLTGNKTLTVHTGDEEGVERILYTGRFNVQSSDVIITGSGKLTLYVDTFADLKGNAAVNENGDAGNLMMYYKGNQEVDFYDETLDFGGNTIFNGSIYAEMANISSTGTTGIQGNIITGGGQVELSGDANAISRVIYAPNAYVSTMGNTLIRGSVISKEFHASGNTSLIYDPVLNSPLPDLKAEGIDFRITKWK